MLAVIHAGVTRDDKGHETVQILVRVRAGSDQADDGALVDGGEHGDGVVTGFKDEVVEVGVAHWFAADGEVEGYVALDKVTG